MGLSLVGHAECYLRWHAETADYRRNHTRYRLSVAPEASESKATRKNMYKFCEITLTIIINMLIVLSTRTYTDDTVVINKYLQRIVSLEVPFDQSLLTSRLEDE